MNKKEVASWSCMRNFSDGDAVQSHCSVPQSVVPQFALASCVSCLVFDEDLH